MDLRKLEVFCKIVELKNFTRAAEVLLVSQPTVSEHVRGLENELGQKLFNRLGKEVEITPVGEILYQYAQKILRTRQEALQAVAQYKGSLAGKISLGCGTIPGTYIMPKLISSFRALHPSITAIMRITSSRIIADKVMVGELEFGIVGARWNEQKLTWLEIYSDELTLAVHPEHRLLSAFDQVPVQTLPSLPFILREPESGTRKVFAAILEEEGIRESDLQVVAEIGSTAAVKEAVKAGIGVSILSSRAVQEDLECGRLATLSIQGHDLQRPFYLVLRKNRELSPVAAAFVQYIQDASPSGRT